MRSWPFAYCSILAKLSGGYFANDRAALEKLIPEETIPIEAGGNTWSNRQTIFDDAARFAKSGGKLLKLEFPKTEIQVYGYTAVVFSNYSYELESGGQRITQAGRVTEVFLLRKGQWVNPGWHMDSGKWNQTERQTSSVLPFTRQPQLD